MSVPKTYKWGILATGTIANKFIQDLKLLPDAEVFAVGSRSITKAKQFAQTYSIPKYYGSYEELANDRNVDIIYIATPHAFHYENIKLCLNAGKHVLCEKAFTLNAKEAEEVIQIARDKRLFLMEAMWVRFTPLFQEIKKIIQDGRIGELKMVVSDFGAKLTHNPENRFFNPELGGGSLLDLGIYPISLCSFLFGQAPKSIMTTAEIGLTGVDESQSAIFRYDEGQSALVSSTFKVNTAKESWIYGTKGSIKILGPWWQLERAIISSEDGERELYMPRQGSGYQYQAEAVQNSISQCMLENDVMPLSESLSIMKTMDKMRHQWGMKYPSG